MWNRFMRRWMFSTPSMRKIDGARFAKAAFIQAEMEVLFELLAYRYKRRSVMLTSNLVFSKWNSILPDKMTAAAVDRVVHHSVVLELDIPSYRAE